MKKVVFAALALLFGLSSWAVSACFPQSEEFEKEFLKVALEDAVFADGAKLEHKSMTASFR
jgi:hypothetical protein